MNTAITLLAALLLAPPAVRHAISARTRVQTGFSSA
jgi:hypothetical protein